MQCLSASNMYRTYFPNMFSFMYLVYHNISPIKRHEIILFEYLFVFFVNMEEILQKNITAQPDNENSLPNDSILQIIEDNQQTTWILTTTGIARYSLIMHIIFIYKLITETQGISGNQK